MDIVVSDSWHGHIADMSADKLMTCCNIGNVDKTCLQKWGLVDTTRHQHFQITVAVQEVGTCVEKKFLEIRLSIDSDLSQKLV